MPRPATDQLTHLSDDQEAEPDAAYHKPCQTFGICSDQYSICHLCRPGQKGGCKKLDSSPKYFRGIVPVHRVSDSHQHQALDNEMDAGEGTYEIAV